MNKSTIVIIVLSLIVAWLAFDKYDTSQENKEREEKIEQLEKDSEVYFNTIKSLDIKLKDVEDSLVVRDLNISLLKDNIIKTQSNAQAKIDAVDDLTNSELQQFFTDRYKGNTGNTSGPSSN